MTTIVQLDQLNFWREDKTILTDVSLTINEGEHWVILGKNGSGKSTILEMINGYLFPSTGQVHVLGQPYGTIDVRDIRRRIGYISQTLIEKLTLRDPVWEVVAGGKYGYLRIYERMPEEVKQQAIDVLEQVNMSEFRNQPFGLLSQGERKKVLLARVLMSDPALLIMDEPCAGLDLYERENFLSLLPIFDEKNVPLIYVTHHIEEIAPVFTHVLLIDDGRIVAAGPKEEVLTPQLIYDAYQVEVTIDWVRGRPWVKVL